MQGSHTNAGQGHGSEIDVRNRRQQCRNKRDRGPHGIEFPTPGKWYKVGVEQLNIQLPRTGQEEPEHWVRGGRGFEKMDQKEEEGMGFKIKIESRPGMEWTKSTIHQTLWHRAAWVILELS